MNGAIPVEFIGGPNDGEVWHIDPMFNIAAQIHKTAEGYYMYSYNIERGRPYFYWLPSQVSAS